MKVKFSVIHIDGLFILKRDLYVKLDAGTAKSVKWGTVVNIPANAVCGI